MRKCEALMKWQLKLILGIGIVFTLTLSWLGLRAYQLAQNPPQFENLRTRVSVNIRLADGSAGTRQVGPQTEDWVDLDGISENLVWAVVSSEDTSFFHHKGIDIHEIKEAIKKDLKERRYARGASTITQQLIKNVYLTNEKSLARKFKEIIWAAELEKKLSKKEVLAFYLNLVEWGPGIYGIGHAAQYYFDSSPRDLSAKQSAFLAMLLPSPRKYHDAIYKPKELTQWGKKRVERILRVMYRMSFISEEDHELAMGEKLWEYRNPYITGDDTLPPADERLGEEPPPPPEPSSEVAEETSKSNEIVETNEVDTEEEPGLTRRETPMP